MSTKSDVSYAVAWTGLCFTPFNAHLQVPLRILPKNENKSEDMVAIMTHLHQYVPMVEKVQDSYVPSIAQTVQVTSARARPMHNHYRRSADCC